MSATQRAAHGHPAHRPRTRQRARGASDFGRTLLISGLFLSALAPGGCTRNLCESDSADPRCVSMVTPGPMALTVVPPRVSLRSGGAITVEVKPAPPDGSMVVLRRPSAQDLVLGAATAGKLTANLSATELVAHSFTPGAAQVVLLQAGQPDLATPLRLFIEPQFTQVPKVYDATGSSDSPMWIAVNKANIVYTLNQFPPFMGLPDRQLRLGEYQLTNNALVARTPPTFGAYRAYPFTTLPPGLAALADKAIVVMSRNPLSPTNPILADLCMFSTGQCQSLNPTSIGFKSVAGFASDRQGSLFAVQSDLGTLAYRGSDMNPFAEKLAIDSANRPTPGNVMAVASGDVDGDSLSDVVLFESGSVSVLLQQADGKQLRYSDTRSAELKTLLGANAPTAAAVADMDADGLDDLLIVRNGAVELFFNQGNGWVAAGAPLQILRETDSLAIGKIDPGTGAGTKMDIAVASSTGQRIAVLINQASF